jgi:hypothetical protein
MGENLHDIDKLFRDSLEGHEELPSEKVWDALDNNLDKSNVIQIKRKYNNLKRLAVALLLLLLGTIIYEIQSKKTGKEIIANNNAAGKANPNGANKKNGQQRSSTVTRSNASNSINSSNAGKDSLNNTVQQAAQDSGINTTVRPGRKSSQQPKNDAAVVNNSDRKKESKDVVENTLADNNEANKSQVKRASGHKTTITVRKGKVEGEPVDANNTAVQNGGGNTTATNNELIKLLGNPAEKINSRLQKDNNAAINSKRVSPDTDLSKNTAKNKSLKNPKPFHFNVTAFYSPQFSFNRLEDDHRDPGPQGPQQGNGREEIKRDEPYERSSSLGVLFEIPLGKKLSLQSGVTYLNKTISIEPKEIYARLDNDGKIKYRFDCSSGYTYISPKSGTTPAVGDSVNAAASTNTLQYVGVPFGVNYSFTLGKFNIIPSIGTTANILVKQKIETELIQGSAKEKQTINNIEGMKPVYFNAYTGVALEYNVSKRIAVNVRPSGNFALSSINKNAAVKSYPNSFGLGAGIKIKF